MNAPIDRDHRSVAELAVARRFPDLDPHPDPAERLRRGHRTRIEEAEIARVWAENVAEARAWLRIAAVVAGERRAWTPAIADMTGLTPLDLWADRLEVDGRAEDAEEVRAFAERILAVDARTPDGRIRHEPPTGTFTAPMAVVHAFPRRTSGDLA